MDRIRRAIPIYQSQFEELHPELLWRVLHKRQQRQCITPGVNPATFTPTLNDPSLRSAYTVETAGTVEQQVGKYTSLTVTYLERAGLSPVHDAGHSGHLIGERHAHRCIDDINQSEGVFRQNQINTNINIRTRRASTSSVLLGELADSNDASTTNPFSSSVDYGRARFGVRSRITLGETFHCRS